MSSNPFKNRSDPSASAHLPALDGLRGIAALWVLIAHCMINGGWYWPPLPSAKIAVDLFMVISGYLMVHQWRRAGDELDARRAARFYIRRFFRIAPVYYLVLLATFALHEHFRAGYQTLHDASPHLWAGDEIHDPARLDFSAGNLLMHLTFLFGLSPSRTFSTYMPDWSISLEMQFYAAFPLLMFLFARRGPLITAAGCLLLAAAINACLPYFPEQSVLSLKLHVFLSGMLAAQAVWAWRESPARALAPALAAMLVAPLDGRIVIGAVALLIALGAAGESRFSDLVNRALGNALMRFLADTSYAVYLVHGLFISLVGGWLFRQPAFVELSPPVRVGAIIIITVIGSYTVGWLLFRTVERAGIDAGRRVASMLDRPRAAVEQAS